MPLDEARLDELLALAEKATPGPWIVQPQPCIYDEDCPDERDTAVYAVSADKQMRLSRIADCWFDKVSRDCENAEFIASCSPETIRALVEDVRESRLLLKICRDTTRAEDGEEIARLHVLIDAIRERLERAAKAVGIGPTSCNDLLALINEGMRK